jgi:predicted nucleotidyltransferase component of viral defense system
MSEAPANADRDALETAPADVVEVDVRAWVEAARANPTLYRDRQVTEIVLASIGIAPTLSTTMVLKGGTLMALAFKSDRVTGDVDFSAQAEPANFDRLVTEELNAALPRTAIRLGYLDLICRVQTVKKMPRSENFEHQEFPALLVRIGSARRGTPEEKKLDAGLAPRVLDVEISFRDQVYHFQELNLTDAGVAVRAFTIHEMIAEKFRALLQQPIRNRYRRQDVYDIAYLLDGHMMGADDRAQVHRTLVAKCATRGIAAVANAFGNPEIARRAESDWNTLGLEVSDLPAFAGRFVLVSAFYKSLPWADSEARAETTSS